MSANLLAGLQMTFLCNVQSICGPSYKTSLAGRHDKQHCTHDINLRPPALEKVLLMLF